MHDVIKKDDISLVNVQIDENLALLGIAQLFHLRISWKVYKLMIGLILDEGYIGSHCQNCATRLD